MRRRPGKPKKVSYELIPRDSVQHYGMYQLLDRYVHLHHPDLRDARIALAWNLAWKPDVDGHVTLGKCKKASDLDRELAAFDFIILLRRSFWLDLRVTDEQREALLDHELCHGALKRDDRGEPVEDVRGRKVYRIRKHSIEEFTEVVERHGMWTADLEAFYAAKARHGAPPFTPCASCERSPGWVLVKGDDGIERATRCACYLAWRAQTEARRDDAVPA